MGINLDYNPAAEMVGKLYPAYFDAQEAKVNALIDRMAYSNIDIKILSDITNKLSHAKKKGKGIDFSNDMEMRRYVAYIHMKNPTIFAEQIHGVPGESPIADEDLFKGEDITLENVLDKTLSGIEISNVKIDKLSEDQIDVILQGLDAQSEEYSTDLNECLMKIKDKYDNRAQMTEHARQIVKQSSDLLESINRKMGR